MSLTLTKLSETATKITLGWTPVRGAIGYRFQSKTTAPKWSHTFDASRTQVSFSKADWYKVEALGVEAAGEYPVIAPPPPPPTGTPVAPGTGTLKAACDAAQAGQTLVLSAGTYIENATCVLKPGVRIVGAGGRNGATVIRGAADPLISYTNSTSPSTISGIRLDGQNKSAGTRGLKVDNVRYLTVADVLSEGFKGTGSEGGAANFTNVRDCEVKDSTFRNSGAVLSDYVMGTLGIGSATDCSFHDLVVFDQSAYAVKGVGGSLTNCQFYNLHCTVGAAFIVTWPAISLEMWNMPAVNVTIRNSYFNRTVSLTAPDSTGVLPSGQYRYIVRNNHFDIPPESQAGSTGYALELHMHSCNIHNNYFQGGVGAINHYGSGQKRGNRVHHNVFDHGENYIGLTRSIGGWFDFEFYKNTWVWRQGWVNSVFLVNEVTNSSDMDIRDNIFASTASLGDKLGAGLGTGVIERNVFYNISARGASAVVPGSQPVALSGGFPNAYVPGATYAAYGAFTDGQFAVGIQ